MIDIDVLTILVGAITAIAAASLPWAYKMNSRLVSIETKIEVGFQQPWMDERLTRVQKDIRDLEKSTLTLSETVRTLEHLVSQLIVTQDRTPGPNVNNGDGNG